MRSLLFVLPLAAFSFSSFACENLTECIDQAKTLTGKTYIISDPVDKKIAPPFPRLDQDNVEVMISHLLQTKGFSRIPIDENTWKVISSRDIRYHALPMIEANRDNPPELGIASDYQMLRYRMAHPEVLGELLRSLRPFMSRYGRIVDMKYSGIVLVQDTADNLRRIYDIIKDADIAPTKDQLERMKRAEERDFKIRWAKARAGKQAD